MVASTVLDPIPRDVLKQFLPDNRSILAFEKLQSTNSTNTDALADAQLLIYTPNPNIPQAKLLVADLDVNFDVATPGQIKFNVLRAPKLTIARNIAMTGDVSWNLNFDGSANVTAAGILANTGVAAGSYTLASVTFDAKGRATSAANGTISVAQLPVTANFSAYRSTSQALPNATQTKVQFDAVDWNVGTRYDPTTNFRFTPNQAGKYLLTAAVSIAISTASIPLVTIAIYKNGALFKGGVAYQYAIAGAVNVTPTVTALVNANGTTDFFEVFAFQSTGAAGSINANSTTTWFQGVFVTA